MTITTRTKKILTAGGWIDGVEALVDGRVVASAATEDEARDKAAAHIAERATVRIRPVRRPVSRHAVTGHGRNPFPGVRGFEDFV